MSCRLGVARISVGAPDLFVYKCARKLRVEKSGGHFYPSACWSATSTSHPCRGHSAVAPSLAIGTSLSAVDDMVCSPEPTFAALALAARATENTLKLTPTVVHGTEAQVTRPRTPSPTHRPTLAPTTHH